MYIMYITQCVRCLYTAYSFYNLVKKHKHAQFKSCCLFVFLKCHTLTN